MHRFYSMNALLKENYAIDPIEAMANKTKFNQKPTNDNMQKNIYMKTICQQSILKNANINNTNRHKKFIKL